MGDSFDENISRRYFNKQDSKYPTANANIPQRDVEQEILKFTKPIILCLDGI